MDLQEKGSGLEIRDDHMKSCSDCHTTRTPLWRGGPTGPKSLCNACGIKYNKKRRQLLGVEGRKQKSKIIKKQKYNKGKEEVLKNNEDEMGWSVKMRLVALGREMGLKNIAAAKLGEVEAAAILLMALSCGSFISSML